MEISTIGLDLAKNVLQVHAVSSTSLRSFSCISSFPKTGRPWPTNTMPLCR